VNKPESAMPSPGSRHDDTLKIRLPSELKAELENAAAEDEETDSLSEYARREFRAGLKIRRSRQHSD
jgi:hypothetical protein